MNQQAYLVKKLFTTGTLDIQVRPGKITFGGHGGAVVRWSVLGNFSIALKHVDYFVVVAKKQGKYKVAGNCNASHSDSSFNFIDYSSVGYVGPIEYFIYAIFLDGSISQRIQIGKTIIPDINIKFRRGN